MPDGASLTRRDDGAHMSGGRLLSNLHVEAPVLDLSCA